MKKAILTLSCLLLFTLMIKAQQGCAPAFLSMAVGSGSSLTAGDFDNNNTLDIATSDGSQKIFVTLNINNTSFDTAVIYITGHGAVAIRNADLNNDGFPELITANGNGNNMSILFNNGNGTFFMPPINYVVGEDPVDLYAKDLDNDADIDIVVARDTAVSIFLNPGNGIFGLPVHYSLPNFHCNQLTIEDLDGDNDKDIAISAYQSNNSLAIMLNNGNGSFGAATYAGSSINNNLIRISPADLDGDNDKDLVLLGSQAMIMLNNGNAVFSNGNTYPLNGNQHVGLTTDDMDGDGDIDMVVISNNDDKNTELFLNNGNASFAPSVGYSIARHAKNMISGDFDADGIVDIAIGDNRTAIIHNNGNGTLDFPSSYDLMNACYHMISAELNGDGKLDLALVGGSMGIATVMNNGTGGFILPEVSYPVGSSGGYYMDNLLATDVDGDGDSDLVLASNNVYVLFNNGSGNFSTSMNYPIGYFKCIEAADFDNDGDQDLCSGDKYYTNNGSGLFTVSATPAIPAIGAQDPRLISGDFNGDGYKDLVMMTGPSFGTVISLNNGNGTFPSGTTIDPDIALDVAAEDFDMDGDLDVIISAMPPGFKWYSNNGNGTFAFPTIIPYPIFNTVPSRIITGDWNIDGFPDFAMSNIAPSVTYYINDTSGSFNRHQYYAPFSPFTLASADFDGNGTPELAVGTLDHITMLDCNFIPNTTGIPETPTEKTNTCSVYPNPITSTAILEISNDLLELSPEFALYDMRGAKVQSFLVAALQTTIEKGNLPGGIYLYRLTGVDGTVKTGKLVVR